MAERVLIVTNDGKDADYAITNQVKEYLTQAGKICLQCPKDENNAIVSEQIPPDLDYAIVSGGDGRFIEVARALRGRDVPILGVNMGTLGYLTEVELTNIEGALERVVKGRYTVEKRMMLEGSFDGERMDLALNDIVVARKGAIRVIHFRLFVNGELLNSYEADGVIISTPTGSTAYNLAAGGPIVEPTASMIVITPICPHALNTSSIVLSAEDEIVIQIGEGKHGIPDEAYVAFDGVDEVELTSGDMVEIRKAEAQTRIIKLNQDSFLETLRRKMKGN